MGMLTLGLSQHPVPLVLVLLSTMLPVHSVKGFVSLTTWQLIPWERTIPSNLTSHIPALRAALLQLSLTCSKWRQECSPPSSPTSTPSTLLTRPSLLLSLSGMMLSTCQLRLQAFLLALLAPCLCWVLLELILWVHWMLQSQMEMPHSLTWRSQRLCPMANWEQTVPLMLLLSSFPIPSQMPSMCIPTPELEELETPQQHLPTLAPLMTSLMLLPVLRPPWGPMPQPGTGGQLSLHLQLTRSPWRTWHLGLTWNKLKI